MDKEGIDLVNNKTIWTASKHQRFIIMKRFSLFVLCFLSLSGLHAKDITDTGNNCMGKAPFQQKEQNAVEIL